MFFITQVSLLLELLKYLCSNSSNSILRHSLRVCMQHLNKTNGHLSVYVIFILNNERI